MSWFNDLFINEVKPALNRGNISGNCGDVHKCIPIILQASKWSGTSQTVSVADVTADSKIIIAPAPESHVDYSNACVYCSNKANRSLSFTCSEIPTVDLTVNVLVFN